jgi:hypothetical protein
MPKRALSPSARVSDPKTKTSKLKTKYNSDWEKECKWLKKGKGPEFAFCKWCNLDFKICYGGKNDLAKHAMTIGHKDSTKVVNSSQNVASMFSKVSVEEDSVARAEALFAFFIAEHNIPFLVADHFSDLVKVMFPDSSIAKKFRSKRTKTTHIVNQALGPYFDNKVTALCKNEKFSIMIDESNDKGDDKMLTILIRVYDETIQKISTRFLGIPTCNIGTGERIFNCLNEVFM